MADAHNRVSAPAETPRPTASATSPQRPPRRPLPSPLAVITATLGLFFVVLTLLAVQVRLGRDPALGPGAVAPVATQPVTGGTKVQQATKLVTRTSPVAVP
jgi:hypothetical protein